MSAVAVDPLTPGLLSAVGLDTAEARARGCSRPVRLRGSTRLVDTSTGEATTVYSSERELDGYTYARCGNRRASVCPSCSHEYKGDAWHLLVCGLAGGRGIPDSVAERPCTFVTLTAPSFGPVHGVRDKGPCRARRDKPVCPHGRPLWCNKRHGPDDAQLGTPLCADCYDYTGHVLWQWYAPELWRRFTIALQRQLAKICSLPVAGFRERCRVSYSKVVEFQARGIAHFHVPIRLDGPEGPDGPSTTLPLSTEVLELAVKRAAAATWLDTHPLRDGTTYRLHWGNQIDCRSITGGADRDSDRRARVVHPEQVAAYLAKYLTKTTEDFGLPTRVTSAMQARAVGASRHAVRIIETALEIARQGEPYVRLRDNLATLGYRGHPITKSRAYSVTFGQIRRSRRAFKRNPGLDPDADIRQVLDDDSDVPEGFELVSSWVFAGQGYLSLDQAAAAVLSAAQSRTR
ncbi:replication initiator [Nocardioides insulae]|uniref:replication initiator n=1 Tax=Nocardioides insulae TaxID=394734 RepID=UPI00041E6E7F|nr:replication initiator [Nocardioides insulae]